MAVYQIYKQLGETPLEAIERYRDEQNIDANTSLTYAGRLDPMAEGLLIVLSGDDVYRKEAFMKLDKVYTLDVLWGIETDTYDLLGVPTSGEGAVPSDEAIERELEKWKGVFDQEYPPYSSKPFHGKPLWQWAREGRLNELDMPTKEVTVYTVNCIGWREVSSDELLRTIKERLSLVTGDFRQEEIWEGWVRSLQTHLEHFRKVFRVSRITVECSSGTYMRSLAHEMGKSLGCGACAHWIRRDRIGTYAGGTH